MSRLVIKDLNFFDADLSQVEAIKGAFSPIERPTFGQIDFASDFAADFKLDTTSGAAGFGVGFGVGIGGQPVIGIIVGTS